MAFEITGPVYGKQIVGPGQHQTLADATATAAFTVLSNAARWVTARIYVKTYVVGTATVGPQVLLEGASDSGFTADRVQFSVAQFPNVATTAALKYSTLVQGYAPLKPLKYWRVVVTLNGTATIALDADIQGAT